MAFAAFIKSFEVLQWISSSCSCSYDSKIVPFLKNYLARYPGKFIIFFLFAKQLFLKCYYILKSLTFVCHGYKHQNEKRSFELQGQPWSKTSPDSEKLIDKKREYLT